LPRTPSKLICNKCNDKGFLSKRPNKVAVQVPGNPTINTIPEACDYAARVCHRLRDMTILFPPSSDHPHHNDESYAQLIYQYFLKYTLHTNEQIKAFESRHSSSPDKNITAMKAKFTSDVKRTTEYHDPYKLVSKMNRTTEDYDRILPVNNLPERKTVHIELPEDSGKITKTSIAYLYAAITCKVIGDTTGDIPYAAPEYNKDYANAIYSSFKLFLFDTRYSYSTIKWLLKILPESYGHNAVAFLDHNSLSNDRTKVRLSNKHLHHKSKKLEQMIEEMESSCTLDYLNSFMNGIEFIMKNNPDLKEDFHKRFQDYEAEAAKGDFLAKYNYYVGHSVDSYNDNKHGRSMKKRWCPIEKNDLADIKISDDRYPIYEGLINYMVKALCEENREKAGEILATARNMLHELGWTENFIDDKIRADIEHVFNQYIAKMNSKIQLNHNNKMDDVPQ
jgi:hypothetical protein